MRLFQMVTPMSQLLLPPRNLTKIMPCFIGLQPSKDSLAYLEPLMTANFWLLKKKGWPVRLVPSHKWHVTVLWFEYLSPEERATLWSHVQAKMKRGAWNHTKFEWQGLVPWHNWTEPKLVAFAANRFNAVKKWGLENWLTDPICNKGLLNRLKSYVPHITMMRFLENQVDPHAQRDWKGEWERIQPQLHPIDPANIRLDRIALYLSDFSQRPHRYHYEYTISIPPDPQMPFDFPE